MSRFGLFASATIALVALTGAANAASFNCNGRLSATEGAICGNPQLSHMDSEMAGLYFRDLNSTIQSYGPHHRYTNQFRSGQVFWMNSRNGCNANYNCLWTMYNDRIAELRSDIGQ